MNLRANEFVCDCRANDHRSARWSKFQGVADEVRECLKREVGFAVNELGALRTLKREADVFHFRGMLMLTDHGGAQQTEIHATAMFRLSVGRPNFQERVDDAPDMRRRLLDTLEKTYYLCWYAGLATGELGSEQDQKQRIP